MRWLTGISLSFLFSFSLAARFFHLLDRPFKVQLLILLVPMMGIGTLIYLVFPRLLEFYRQATHRFVLVGQALLAGLLFATLDAVSLPLRLAGFLSIAILVFLLALPAASAYAYVAGDRRPYSLLITWVMATPVAFLATGFLSHSYPAYWLGPLAFLLWIVAGAAAYGILNYTRARAETNFGDTLLALLILAAGMAFSAALFWLVWQYPSVFDRRRFLLGPHDFGLFLAVSLLAPVWLAWGMRWMDKHGWLARWKNSRLGTRIRGHLPGIALGVLFFTGYAFLSYAFNHPSIDLTENFLAADIFAWAGRLAAPNGTQIEMRAVHPFAFFIFRPIVWFFALFFNDDRYTATLILVPLVGGICVFLAYLFVKRWSGSQIYALLMAALLGASTSHLLFGALVESYIFSAAALLLFFVLLLEDRTHWLALVTVGVLTFGITITNFIQTFLGFVVARPRLRAIFMYGLVASALAIVLTALHGAVFPSALVFYDPAGVGVESEYSIPFLGQPGWRVTGRIVMLLRNIFLYSIIAPHPFILTTEVGGTFPRFNFFKLTPGNYSFSSYSGIGTLLVGIWAVLLLAAGLAFLVRAARTRRFDLSLAFPLVILFNFLLHLTYGYEPFLYSADWTYALVLFVAASLSSLGRQRWFQAVLGAFLILLMLNQWRFIGTMLQAIAPFFK